MDGEAEDVKFKYYGQFDMFGEGISFLEEK